MTLAVISIGVVGIALTLNECEGRFVCYKQALSLQVLMHVCVFLQESMLDADHHVAVALGLADKPVSVVRTQTTHLFNV